MTAKSAYFDHFQQFECAIPQQECQASEAKHHLCLISWPGDEPDPGIPSFVSIKHSSRNKGLEACLPEHI